MLKILKPFLLTLLMGCNLCHGATDITLPSDENAHHETNSSMYQFDICKLSDGLEWPWRIFRFPLKLYMYLFKECILEDTKYLSSKFLFKSDTPIYGLENKKGTCYMAALMQALKASSNFVSFINYMAAEEDWINTERGKNYSLAGNLKALLDAMNNPNAGINDVEPQHMITSLLRNGFKTDPNVPVHFLKGVESLHYDRIADSMKFIAAEIEDTESRESINKVADKLKAGNGGSPIIFFANMWFALDTESKIMFQNGIFNQIAGGEYFLNTLWFTRFSLNGYGFSNEWEPGDIFNPPFVLISTGGFESFQNTGTGSSMPNVSNYKLTSIVVHHEKSLFSGNHCTAIVLGADGNWYNANNEYVFFAGTNLDIPASTKLYIYERR